MSDRLMIFQSFLRMAVGSKARYRYTIRFAQTDFNWVSACSIAGAYHPTVPLSYWKPFLNFNQTVDNSQITTIDPGGLIFHAGS